MPTNNGNHTPKDQSPPARPHQDYMYLNEQASSPVQQHQDRHSFRNSPVQSKQQHQSRHSTSGSVVITTQWETFDSTPAPLLDHFSSPTTTSSTHAAVAQSRISWDLLWVSCRQKVFLLVWGIGWCELLLSLVVLVPFLHSFLYLRFVLNPHLIISKLSNNWGLPHI